MNKTAFTEKDFLKWVMIISAIILAYIIIQAFLSKIG